MYSLTGVINASLIIYFNSLLHSSSHQIFPFHSHSYSLSFFLLNIISYGSLTSHTDFSALTNFSNFLISCIKVKSIIQYNSINSFGLFIEQTLLTIIAVFCLTLEHFKMIAKFFVVSIIFISSVVIHSPCLVGARSTGQRLKTFNTWDCGDANKVILFNDAVIKPSPIVYPGRK